MIYIIDTYKFDLSQNRLFKLIINKKIKIAFFILKNIEINNSFLYEIYNIDNKYLITL